MPETPGVQNSAQDELNFLRGKIGSLAMRGEYTECIKLIEENIGLLYTGERWPEVFFTNLRTYQRCMGLINKLDSLEERLVKILKKSGAPYVFAYLLRLSDPSINWNPDYFKNLAMMNERNEDYEAALSYCDIIIKLDPSSSAAHVLRGWILDDLKRYGEAVSMYEQAIELNEANHSARNSLAKHFADTNPQLALEYIEKAIELAPGEGSYYDTKAKILIRLDDHDGAIACYDLAISSSPYAAEYPYKKGELLLGDGKEIAAIAQYRKALALDGDHIPTLWRLAVLYKDSQPEMALTYLNTIASLQPDNNNIRLLRGLLLVKLGKEDLAAEEFKELIDADPRQHEALAGYANLILHTNPTLALEFYDKAIALSPDNSGYHVGRARALELLEMDAQAIKEYRKVIDLDRSNAKACARLAALLSDTKPREAVDMYTKAIGIMPENAFYHAAKAELLMSMKRKDEALVCFLNASKYDPSNAKLHALLGKMLDEQGNTDAAQEHLKQAVSLDRSNPDAFYRLAKLLFNANPESAEIALLHINSAISLNGSNSDYYFFKSQVLNTLGHDRSALEHLQGSLRTDPKNTAALNEISLLLSGDSPKVALMYADRAIGMNPDNQEYLCQRASLLFAMGQKDKAAAQYTAALKLDPKSHKAMFGLGKCLFPEPEALEYLGKAIALDNKVPEYHAEKASLLTERGEYSAAIDSYGAAIALDSANYDYLLQRAKLFDLLGKYDDARNMYRSVLAYEPGNLDALSRLGALLADFSPAEALLLLDHAIDLDPKGYIHHAWKGRAHLALGDKTLAAAEYQTASRLGGETGETYFILAELLQNKMPEIALGYSLRSIEEDKGVADYHMLCGDIYLNLGQDASALDCYKTAVSLNPDRHDAREKIACIFFDRNDPDALKAVDFALEQDPRCVKCLFMYARLLNAREGERDIDGIIGYIDKILEIDPKHIPAREMLIKLLAEKRSFVRLNMEKIRLGRIRKA